MEILPRKHLMHAEYGRSHSSLFIPGNIVANIYLTYFQKKILPFSRGWFHYQLFVQQIFLRALALLLLSEVDSLTT